MTSAFGQPEGDRKQHSSFENGFSCTRKKVWRCYGLTDWTAAVAAATAAAAVQAATAAAAAIAATAAAAVAAAWASANMPQTC